MQRLIMTVHYSDECTYSFTDTHPIMYESAEKALCDFEEMASSTKKQFKFCGHSFYGNGGIRMSTSRDIPDFYTVDEWFDLNLVKTF